MTLTKADLVQKVYQNHNLTKAQAADTVEAFLRIAKDCLNRGEDLLISGFGKFSVRQKNARRGRNPQTKENLILRARRVVVFKTSGVLRNRINGE
jgi:integration host factor subunit alpha